MAVFLHRPIYQEIGMRLMGKSTLLGITVAAAAALGAQAAPPTGSQPTVTRTVLASNYNPYAHGLSPCPQGAPAGGPKCHKLIPASHPRIG
jgi:hypothetical protein